MFQVQCFFLCCIVIVDDIWEDDDDCYYDDLDIDEGYGVLVDICCFD